MSAMKSIGNVADHVVGDMILGSIGRVGYHLGQVPVFSYIGANIGDGYRAAEVAATNKEIAKKIETMFKGQEPPVELIEQNAIALGADPKAILKILGLARENAEKDAAKEEAPRDPLKARYEGLPA